MFDTVPSFSTTQAGLPEAVAALATSLGCGLLVGIERERRKGSGPGRAFAGLRTFALTCVVGAVAALTGLSGLVVTGALLVAALGVVAYWRDRSEDPGVTTEMALLLTYLIGVLCAWSLPLAWQSVSPRCWPGARHCIGSLASGCARVRCATASSSPRWC